MSATGKPDANTNVIAFPRPGGKPTTEQQHPVAHSAQARAILAAIVRAHGPLTITTDQLAAARDDQPFLAFDPLTRVWTVDVLPTPQPEPDTAP